MRAPSAVVVIACFAPPCQHEGAAGLEGEDSALFFEEPRLNRELGWVFADLAVVDFCENRVPFVAAAKVDVQRLSTITLTI